MKELAKRKHELIEFIEESSVKETKLKKEITELEENLKNINEETKKMT